MHSYQGLKQQAANGLKHDNFFKSGRYCKNISSMPNLFEIKRKQQTFQQENSSKLSRRDQGEMLEARGIGTRGGGGGHLKFFERTKSALFVMKSTLFVQTNIPANTNLTSKVPFVFPQHIYVCPCMLPSPPPPAPP